MHLQIFGIQISIDQARFIFVDLSETMYLAPGYGVQPRLDYCAPPFYRIAVPVKSPIVIVRASCQCCADLQPEWADYCH